jgi:hypothetical protein
MDLRRGASQARAARTLRCGLLASCLIASAMGLPGCILTPRKPTPVITVEVVAHEGVLRVNGSAMNDRQAHEELRQLAEQNRDRDGHVDAVIRLSSEATADYDRVRDLEDYCASLGLVRIEKDN